MSAHIFDPISGQFAPYIPPMLTSGVATPGAAGSGVPVTVMSSDALWAKKKNQKFKGRVPLSKRMNLSQNVVEYMWHCATPYHAKYGAIPIVNGVDKAANFNSQSEESTHLMACHLYDLTCAPNYVRSPTADTSNAWANEMSILNPNVMYQVLMKGGQAGPLLGGPKDWIPQKILIDPSGIGAAGSALAIYPQRPDGRVGDNKWYLKYMKKPIPQLYSNNLLYGDTVPIGTKGQDNANEPKVIPTPPVGRRPVHVSTDVKMCLVGCSNEAVTYDISLVRFTEDFLLPRQSHVANMPDQGPVRTAWQSGAYNGETTEVAGVQQGLNANAAVAFWQQFCLPFTHGPGASGDSKLVKKYCQVLGKKVVTIQPKSTIDGDQASNNHTYVSFKFKWNDVMSYSWRKDSDIEMNPAVPYYTAPEAHGMGFTTNISIPGNITTSPSPRSRIFLVVRCRSAHLYSVPGITVGANASTTAGSSVGSGADWESIASSIPTYDISISNKFIPDLAS